jgi:hypothetical protein
MHALAFFSPFGRKHLYNWIEKYNFTGFITKHHAMKAYWGSGGIAPVIL